MKLYRKIKIIHKLIFPPLLAFFFGGLFILGMLSVMNTIQIKIHNLESNLIPSVEKANQNVTLLKNMSEKYVFSILASEIDMLPTAQDAKIIEENLKEIIENRALEMTAYEHSLRTFQNYFTLAASQAKSMLTHPNYRTDNSVAPTLMKEYRSAVNDFQNISLDLKKMIIIQTKDLKETTKKIIYFTIIFMLVFSFFLFAVSFVVYKDFYNKFKLLKNKLFELDLVTKEQKDINVDLDELSIITKKINHKIETFKNLEDEKNKIESLANRDQLTNLYNRRYIEVTHTILKEKKVDFGVIMLDIDFFKSINDNYGHDIGDEVLSRFARILDEHTRKNDLVVRYGGEEFVIVMYSVTIKVLLINAERLRKIIEMKPFPKVGKVTASFGVALHTQDYDIYETIKYADGALYNAKESGRNNVKYQM